jgi:cephalosporin-C deacetylase-like acetyl esterase
MERRFYKVPKVLQVHRVEIMRNLIYLTLLSSLFSCGNSDVLPVSEYYEYDRDLPLQDSVTLIKDTAGCKLFYVTYRSVHNKKVTGLLSVPENGDKPLPVIILMHGKGDRKTVDYIEYGNKAMNGSGYAVLRLDFSNHGDRFENDFDFSFTGKNRYWTRNIISQTVFDLRRAVDFICTKKELDSERIGYYGISLGGITGTVFCSIDKRVKVPVIVLGGGQMNLMFGTDALSADTQNYLSIIEPMNFVKQIAPRPLLMINAENDDIILPMMSKLLFREAEEPKEIIWYPAKHHTIPLDKVYDDGIEWFKKHL